MSIIKTHFLRFVTATNIVYMYINPGGFEMGHLLFTNTTRVARQSLLMALNFVKSGLEIFSMSQVSDNPTRYDYQALQKKTI